MIDGFFRPLLEFARPHRLALMVGVVSMLVETGVALAVPWLGGRFVSDFLGGNRPSMVTILLLIAALFSAQALLHVASGYVFAKRAALILADIRVRLYGHIQSLPIAFFQQRQQGSLLSILTSDVAIISHYLSETLIGVIPMLMTVVGSVAFMLAIDTSLAVLATLAIPVFYLLIKIAGRRVRPLAHELQEAYARAFAVEQENIDMLPAIKAFTRESAESARYQTRVDEVVRLTLKQQWLDSAMGPGVQWLAGFGVLIILWLAGDQIIAGRIGTGELVAFLLYASLLTRPVSALAGFYGATERARASMERLQTVFCARPERYLKNAPEVVFPEGRIEYIDVTFAYPDREPILNDFNLAIAARETIAITGENGAGKTTLISMLMRYVEPKSGRILIDGIDIAEVGLTRLREQIAIVPQHVFLFNGTVRDNIGYGRAGSSEADVVQAAQLAQAHRFIVTLPSGYDTVIGDHGVRLSGGQRQRIALARALLKKPAILILDEATAMFDPEGELDFLNDCQEVLHNRTVLLITHRPASLALADRVIRLSPKSEADATWPQIDFVARQR